VQTQRPSTQEYWLLKLLLLHEDLIDWAVAHLDATWVQHPLARQIVSHRLQAHRNHTWNSLAAFLEQCSAPGMQNLITEVVAENRSVPNPAQQMADVTLRLRNQFIDREMAGLMQRLGLPELSDSERVDLLRRQQDLRALKRAPLCPLPESGTSLTGNEGNEG
jgi:hypothetical protein